MKKILVLAAAITTLSAGATLRERVCFDQDWLFSKGHATSAQLDYGCGTEYFTYLAKAASIHNEGPYSPKFNTDSCGEWTPVDLPHDWVVDLPYSPEASHSHGYKCVGWKYPENSVGWYRKTFSIPEDDMGKSIALHFDGIFRDARVWVNGFYLGNEPSGYVPHHYDITPYLNYGGDNVVAVRADASIEEGWYYEGAGIYRHVWLEKTPRLHIACDGVFPVYHASGSPTLEITADVVNDSPDTMPCHISFVLTDGEGRVCGSAYASQATLLPRQRGTATASMDVADPSLWSLDSPTLYTLRAHVICEGDTVDTYTVRTGLRDARFDPDKGFLLNGRSVKLLGVNLHQDHAGVGTAIPDALWLYRLQQLKKLGVNAIRSSHNPISPQVLDLCDSLGIVVLDENRLTGVNDEHLRQLTLMIKRDRHHPSVIAYSVGNEEWGIEWNDFGSRIVEVMRDHCHLLDPSRPMTVASSSGPTVLVPADVAGYNYILQNPVDRHRADYPRRCAWGTEETTGCGTRGVYFPSDEGTGRMPAINRRPSGPDSLYNCIERGWKFYDERPWLAGLFYWTGFDYRGEPNPLKYPATGSEFGILDYCGFPKDEAWYLQSWWTDRPVLHILPHWNLAGHEGEEIPVWVYSNCDEVELWVNGRSLGRKAMPRGGHLEWTAPYQPGTVEAIGYNNGRMVATENVETTGAPTSLSLDVEFTAPDKSLLVYTVSAKDAKGRIVPDACVPFTLEVAGDLRVLGYGNGDPAFTEAERPVDRDDRTFTGRTFNGVAQVLVQPIPGSDDRGKSVSIRIE